MCRILEKPGLRRRACGPNLSKFPLVQVGGALPSNTQVTSPCRRVPWGGLDQSQLLTWSFVTMSSNSFWASGLLGSLK